MELNESTQDRISKVRDITLEEDLAKVYREREMRQGSSYMEMRSQKARMKSNHSKQK